MVRPTQPLPRGPAPAPPKRRNAQSAGPVARVEETHDRLLVRRYNLKLDILSRSELCGLVTEWTGQKMRKNLAKEDYIAVLEDTRLRITTFKFLELPPELRNHIYLELLTLHDRRGHQQGMSCFPKILRTNKQIWNEASAILYSENTPEVTFTQRPQSERYNYDRNTQTVSINYERRYHVRRNPPPLAPVPIQMMLPFPAYGTYPPGPAAIQPPPPPADPQPPFQVTVQMLPASLAYRLPEWPQRLARFKSINVTITVDKNRRGLSNLSRDLYMFAMSMVASKTLKNVAVKIKPDHANGWITKSIEEVFWPIAFLTSKESVVLSGIPNEVMASMNTKVALLEPLSGEHDLLAHAYEVQRRGTTIVKLWKELEDESGTSILLKQNIASYAQLQHNVFDIMGMLTSDIVIAPLRHAMFVENVRRLDAFLRGPDAALVRSTALAKADRIKRLLAAP